MNKPTINVNLKPCMHPHMLSTYTPDEFPNAPVLVPLPLDKWRSVTFTVRLGECIDAGRSAGSPIPRACAPDGVHHERCPARPIRVSCSISGKTWEESEVDEVEVHHDGRETSPAELLRACRDRWALVKALVLNQSIGPSYTMVDGVRPLAIQRDAVYAAIADMARADVTRTQAWLALPLELRQDPGPTSLAGEVLERYVERLIEQVGALP